MKLDGRVAVVTGGATGIGAAIGHLFAAEGARVALIDTDTARGEETCRGICSEEGIFLVSRHFLPVMIEEWKTALLFQS